MTRVAEVKEREALPESQRPAFDEIVASRGAIRGPFGILLHSPELARRAAAVGVIQNHRVPDDLFERLKTRLGLSELVEIVAAIGYWTFVAATLNTFEVR